MGNILIVHGIASYPLRATTRDHLECFRRYSGQRVVHLNMRGFGFQSYRRVPGFIRRMNFDLIIFHADLLGVQWYPGEKGLQAFIRKAEAFRHMPGLKVAFMQDEYYNTVVLEKFIHTLNIQYVFSLAAPSEWKKIYPSVDFKRVKFFRSLPGYLDERTLARIDRLATHAAPERPIDIGYRAYGVRQWLGRHGYLKIRIAEVFQEQAPKLGLVTDISTRREDTFYGDDWYRFLLRCNYAIAVEGGATVLDRDGRLAARTVAYLDAHPGAAFEEVEAACFPGQDGYYRYMAISPKHLEACATRTCQVLIEGEYNGILKAGEHYIELKRDFSNLAEVLETVCRDDLRSSLVERAHADVVESGRYTYRNFVRFVLNNVLAPDGKQSMSSRHEKKERILMLWGRIDELLSLINAMIHSTLYRSAKTIFSLPLIRLLRDARRIKSE